LRTFSGVSPRTDVRCRARGKLWLELGNPDRGRIPYVRDTHDLNAGAVIGEDQHWASQA
jgi:hypothetical protein